MIGQRRAAAATAAPLCPPGLCRHAEVERQREIYISSRFRHSLSHRRAFQELLEVLEGALAIGRQADLLAPQEVTTRLQAVQHMAPPAMVAPSSKLAKIKAWFDTAV
jgi:hypothetical protein